MQSRRIATPVPALAIWIEGASPAEEAHALGAFFVARFAGRAVWVIADRTRDAFLDDEVAFDEPGFDRERQRATASCGFDQTVEIARTPMATPAFLMALPRRTGFSWDGWLLVDGRYDRSELSGIVDAWRDSRTHAENRVPPLACYPYGDGSGVVWVPSVALDEAERLLE